jgi:hypothetical protein
MRYPAEVDTIRLTKALKKWCEAVGKDQEALSVVSQTKEKPSGSCSATSRDGQGCSDASSAAMAWRCQIAK